MNSEQINDIVSLLHQSKRLLFITGAGLSADSGLPTYRGIGGLYDDQLTEEDIPIEVALSGEMLRRNAALSWKYIAQIEAACRGARFNSGHRIIADLQNYFEHVCVLTQNVDGFHRDAGSHNLIEMHGYIHDLLCMSCDYQSTVDDFSGLEIPPSCPHCAGLLRPDVVMFGELLPEAAISHYYRELSRGFDMVFSIGTTSVFPYISGPVLEARRRGVPTVEINPGFSEISDYVDIKLAAGAAASLQTIWDRIGFC